jgi:hypothetical protein
MTLHTQIALTAPRTTVTTTIHTPYYFYEDH